MSEWYAAENARNATGGTLALFGEKGFLVGGASSSNGKKPKVVAPVDSPWLQVDGFGLPTLEWEPMMVNSSGLLNRCYHASAGISALGNRIFVFGGSYSATPEVIASDVVEIETGGMFGVQASVCEAASDSEANNGCTARKGLSATVFGTSSDAQKVLLFGGVDLQGGCTNELWLFHPEHGTNQYDNDDEEKEEADKNADKNAEEEGEEVSVIFSL